MPSGIPVVIAANGRGIPVVETDSPLAPLMSVAETGLGIPIVLSTNGLGTPARIEGGGQPEMPIWQAARQEVIDGTGNARVLIVGDSTVVGSGGGGAGYGADTRRYNFPLKLAAKLTAEGIPSRADAVYGRGNRTDYATFDPRLVLTNWSQADNVSLATVIGRSITSNIDAATYNITPLTTWDRAEIIYVKNAGQGTFTLAVDGGAVLHTISANAAAGIGRQPVSAPNLGLHTLNIGKVSTGRVHVLGWRFWSSADAEVEIIQAGGSGWGTQDFVQAANAWECLNQIANEAADLLVINLTINDWNAQLAEATYRANLGLIIDTQKNAGGDVLVITGVPSNPATQASLSVQQQYVSYARSVAASKGARFLNIHSRWGGDFATKNAVGWYADDLHPYGIGATGYDDIAEAVFEQLIA